jgi:Flp pilus assembly protein TadD
VTPQLLINLVNASVGDGRFQEAIATAQTLTRLSDRPESFERLGWALFRAGNYNESEVAYRQAAALDATYWPAWNGIGVNNLNAWLNSDKRDSEAGNEARRAFRASLKANPDQPKIIKLFTTYGL